MGISSLSGLYSIYFKSKENENEELNTNDLKITDPIDLLWNEQDSEKKSPVRITI